MTDFKTILLSEIRPDKNQPRKFFDDHSLKELTESVKLKGVLQPIMVRPNGKGYILVCGERRLKASTAAGLTEVPAVIRNLSDEEALEIQFIENIQRDDVHPMDEASTFKSMIESKVRPYTIADIAAKINKPEKFVTHRLSLNNLIPELQQDFWKGKFLIGHAVLFSRLSPEDQKLCIKECKDRWGDKNNFQSIQEVKSFISRNIMRVLSSAPFKKDDPTLNPEMGPCTSCHFRSGNNPTLFDEVKETDRCFKPACFEKKIEEHLIRTVKTFVVEEPGTMFLYNGYSTIKPEISKVLKEYGVVPLKEYHDFNTYVSKGDVKVKGIWITGNEAGKIQHVSLDKKSKAVSGKTTAGKPSNNAIDVEIEGIKQRTKRAAELDDEKVWKRIHDEIIKEAALINSNTLSKVDTASVIYSMARSAGYSSGDRIKKIFGGGTDKQLVEKMLKATPDQFNQACRLFAIMALDSAVSSHSASAGQGLLKQVAEQYHKDKITTFELEQKEKREKREARASQRIKALQDQKKQKPVKVTDKPAKKVKVKAPKK